MQASGPLVVTDVVKRFAAAEGAIAVLDGVSLRADPGEAVAIVGPSGSGKSTLLSIIGALERPTAGSVRLGEMDVTALSRADVAGYRAARIGFVFQDHHLLPQLTAVENVLLPTLAAAAPASKDAPARARALLERVGVAHRADAFPARMSGGERQRVAVARALINGAGLLLADEPTGNLDHDAGANVVELLLDLAKQQGVTVLMVTHNLEHAARFARCLELRGGRLVSRVGGRP